MTANHSVNWNKTCVNIANRLSGLVWEKDLAPIVNLSERQVQNKLTGKELSVEELALFASLLGCTMEELIVFEHEMFVEPERCVVKKCEKPELKTLVEVVDMIDFRAENARACEIQNLAEFLLYMPLMPQKSLQDVLFRCGGNLTSFNRQYFINQMNYLYSCLPNIPAKEYADAYRDEVLRVKGDGELIHESNEYKAECYWNALLLYTGQIDGESYLRLLKELDEAYCK